ncbi:MAG TPA: hypothetical protein VFM70_10295 [Salinimicrobium sp.]|nr:hypothetical protein [Salinimicrobium sp.]
MKIIVPLIFLFVSVGLWAQDCEYVLNDDITKSTPEFKIYDNSTPLETKKIYFSLYQENGVPFLIFKYSKNSKSFLPAICINQGARLSFQLVNGTIVSLLKAGPETCSYSEETEDKFQNNQTVGSLFYLAPDDIKNLQGSKINLIGFRTTSDNESFVISSISDQNQPRNYFIDNLHCIE